jgi:hypothetical protein
MQLKKGYLVKKGSNRYTKNINFVPASTNLNSMRMDDRDLSTWQRQRKARTALQICSFMETELHASLLYAK